MICGQATTQTDEGGYEFTAYEIVVNGPEGEKKALKRYSEFEALKEKLAASDDAKSTALPYCDACVNGGAAEAPNSCVLVCTAAANTSAASASGRRPRPADRAGWARADADPAGGHPCGASHAGASHAIWCPR